MPSKKALSGTSALEKGSTRRPWALSLPNIAKAVFGVLHFLRAWEDPGKPGNAREIIL